MDTSPSSGSDLRTQHPGLCSITCVRFQPRSSLGQPGERFGLWKINMTKERMLELKVCCRRHENHKARNQCYDGQARQVLGRVLVGIDHPYWASISVCDSTSNPLKYVLWEGPLHIVLTPCSPYSVSDLTWRRQLPITPSTSTFLL